MLFKCYKSANECRFWYEVGMCVLANRDAKSSSSAHKIYIYLRRCELDNRLVNGARLTCHIKEGSGFQAHTMTMIPRQFYLFEQWYKLSEVQWLCRIDGIMFSNYGLH